MLNAFRLFLIFETGGYSNEKIDVSRLSLWHSKYKAQIRDFSTIRDGDALLLRSLDDSNGGSQILSPSKKVGIKMPSVTNRYELKM